MKLKDILETTIPGLGFELVDFEITPGKIIRVFIDKPAGGVGIEDCALVSNHLNHTMIVEEISYNRLEVSSPGLERSLKKLADYIRFTGRLAKIKTFMPINDQKVFQGRIDKVIDQKIELILSDNQRIQFDFADISQARLIFEPQPK